MEFLAVIALPATLVVTAAIILLSRRDLFSEFLAGAREGLECAIGLFPAMTALMCAVGMLMSGGFAEIASKLLSPILSLLGIPAGVIPIIAVRPFSGSASSATLAGIFELFGVDSPEGLFASVFYASAETALYIVAVYFSAVGIKRTRWALPASLIVMTFALCATSLACRWFFGD